MRRRPLGHDVVVASLLLLSCSSLESKEVSRKVVASADAPVKVVVEQIGTNLSNTAGCGSTNHGMTPTCAGTHCTATHAVLYTCEVLVERGQPARAAAKCYRGKSVELKVDPKGERFATREAAEDPWQIFAGGFGGRLAVFETAGAPIVGDLSWARLPPASEMVRADLASVIGGTSSDSQKQTEGALENLGAIDPDGFVDALARFASSDTRVDECTRATSPWMSAAQRLPLASRHELARRLLASFDAPSPKLQEVVPAVGLTTSRDLLDHVGDPSKYIAGHTSELTTSAVLDAWSRTDAVHAGAFACKALAKPLEPILRRTAYFAVARAKLRCEAVRKIKEDACMASADTLLDLDASTKELEEPDHFSCKAEVGYALAVALASTSPFGKPEFEAFCEGQTHD